MGNKEINQFVDPEVTRIKVDREFKEFEQNEREYRKMGIIRIGIKSNTIQLLFAIPHINPHPIAFAVEIDYTNWDAEPPSLNFIDPFTGERLQRELILIQLLQKTQVLPQGGIGLIDLLQGGNGIMPFLCIPGIKEYHEHPAHTGDSWMLHRTNGEGKLCVIIEQLHRHSIAQAAGYGVNVAITGINPDIQKIN